MIVLCLYFCVYWLEMMCAYLYIPPIRAGIRNTCMNPGVEFTVFKIVFYNFDHACDQVYNKRRILTHQNFQNLTHDHSQRR